MDKRVDGKSAQVEYAELKISSRQVMVRLMDMGYQLTV